MALFCRVGCGLSGRCLSSTGALWDECEPVRGVRAQVLQEILAAPWRCGAVSGEHGIGTAVQKYFLELRIRHRGPDAAGETGIRSATNPGSGGPVRLTSRFDAIMNTPRIGSRQLPA